MTKSKRSCGMVLGHGLSCQPGYQCGNCSYIEKLEEELATLGMVAAAGIDCAQRVANRRESEDLAEAVRILEVWAVQATNYLLQEEEDD